MKLVLCQLDSVWENISANLAKASAALEAYINLNGVPDLFVLPEFFNSGYTMDTAFAEDEQGPSLAWMKDSAAKYGCAIAGSMPFKDGEAAVNRLFFVTPEGVLDYYDKHQLFTFANEHKSYSPGKRKVIVEYKGWRIRLAVCYDLRFPVWLRNKGCEYDLLLNVANWPDIRVDAADTLAKARAIENLCFTAFCNRFGVDRTNTYNGNSLIIDSMGRSIGKLSSISGHTFVSADIDIEPLQKYRQSFQSWRDADEFELLLK
ncbi:MAG: hypothetical protein HUJ93_07805 [Bacteroidales bacterium]|nr:hypothetical protein [Bacteroidales bacterium]